MKILDLDSQHFTVKLISSLVMELDLSNNPNGAPFRSSKKVDSWDFGSRAFLTGNLIGSTSQEIYPITLRSDRVIKILGLKRVAKQNGFIFLIFQSTYSIINFKDGIVAAIIPKHRGVRFEIFNQSAAQHL